jgi:GTP 3',8-cyclase
MFDKYERWISYLRISVTDRCNLRCGYCMPAEGLPARREEDYLSFEEIASVAAEAAKLGIRKVRLTGGEPLLRQGIDDLVRMLKTAKGLEQLTMTTNGQLLPVYARPLRAAGLDSLNISLDTLDPGRYSELTRGGDLSRTLEGLGTARAEGFPINVNMVVLDDTRDEEIEGMRVFCSERGLALRLIRRFSLAETKNDSPAWDRPPRCGECNRIRLTADGCLKPCLHSDTEIKVDMSDIGRSLKEAILNKPERGAACRNRSMAEIGG